MLIAKIPAALSRFSPRRLNRSLDGAAFRLIFRSECGCWEITLDEPSMSCYAHREDPRRFVEIFAETVKPILGRCRLSTHLCFGNYKGRAVGPRRYVPLFPAFLDLPV